MLATALFGIGQAVRKILVATFSNFKIFIFSRKAGCFGVGGPTHTPAVLPRGGYVVRAHSASFS